MPSPLRPPPPSLSPGSTVWAYLRDSGGPRQDQSIQQQRDIIIEYCDQHGLVLTHPPFEDVHKSGGSTLDRDQFEQMIALSATESFRPQGLLIWNFARFSRGGPDESQLYKAVLRTRGVVIHSLTDDIPSGDFGPVIETLIDVANKQKKDEAALGAWRGLRHIVKQGAMPGIPPRGFMRTPITVTSEQGDERQAHRWEPDPEYIPRVRKAFQMRAAGHSLDEINKATRLFGSINSWSTFFNNKLYIGILEYGSLTIEDYCKPMIGKSLWDKVQAHQAAYAQKHHMQAGSKKQPRRAHTSFLLSGLIECARCGSPLYGHLSKQRNNARLEAYRCTRRGRRRDCELPRIPSHTIEQAVITKLQEAVQDPIQFEAILEQHRQHSSTARERNAETRKIKEDDLKKVRRKLANITSTIEDTEEGKKSKTLAKRLAQLEHDETDLQRQLAALPREEGTSSNFNPEKIKNRLAQLTERLKNATPDQARQILAVFVHKVIVDRIQDRIYGRVEIYFPHEDLLPPSPAGPRHPPRRKPSPNDGKISYSITVPTSRVTVGAPPCTHSIPFECRVVKKPRSQ